MNETNADALKEWQKRQESEAFAECLSRAEAGDINAIGKLFTCYNRGTGGAAHDVERADYWLSRWCDYHHEHAERGEAESMFLWGFLLRDGAPRCGIPKDRARSLVLVKQAAEAGYSLACEDYGRWLVHGAFGLEKDEAAGFAFLSRCGRLPECPNAKRDLACCYHYGVGTAKDEDQAFLWYVAWIDEGDDWQDSDLLAVAGEYERRGDLAAALRWYEDAADGAEPDPTAEKVIGMWLYCGKGTPRDLKRAKKLLAHAAGVGGDDDAAKLYYFILDEEKHGLCGRTPTCLPVDVPPLNYRWSPIE